FTLVCACGFGDLAIWLDRAERRRNPCIDQHWVLGGAGHIFLTESYRYASASLVAPFDYTAMIWALVLGYAMFGETPTVEIIGGSAIIAAAGLFVIWRERQLAMMRRRDLDAPAAARAATTLRTP